MSFEVVVYIEVNTTVDDELLAKEPHVIWGVIFQVTPGLRVPHFLNILVPIYNVSFQPCDNELADNTRSG